MSQDKAPSNRAFIEKENDVELFRHCMAFHLAVGLSMKYCVYVCILIFLYLCSLFCYPFGGGGGGCVSTTGNKKLVLKIGDDRESGCFGSKIDVYFNLREGQVYPLGLYVGSQVELTWLCLRKTQKTDRLYCTSTLLTCIRLVKLGRNFG